jgi:signal transduction histidine kinase
MRVEWQVRDLPPIPDLTPSKVLRVLRILKGAVANAVERPGARTLTVRTGTRPGDASFVYVEIGDDGPGGRPSAAAASRMAEMARAAHEIGATLDGAPGENAAIRLTIPL